MSHRSRLNRQASEAVLLTHMELTRVRLLAANVRSRAAGHAAARAHSRSLASVGRPVSAAPLLAMLGCFTLGALLIGPRRVLPVVMRTGLAGWIVRNVRLRLAR
ncbi:hypothetical protein [Paraburkholderia nodosa]|uniref:hypothetical protein n=1 Tax=Paraburkholderia nodosa TaxID=392320 RepID=UPI00159F1B6E|nr:hypothetical protein [Paraburkholderia nodosa]